MKTLRYLAVPLLILFALFAPALAMAQTTDPGPGLPPPVSTALLAIIAAIVPLVASGVTAVVSKLLPNFPSFLKPVLVVALGAVVNLLPTLNVGGKWAVVVGALLGGAAVVIHQVITLLQKKGVSG